MTEEVGRAAEVDRHGGGRIELEVELVSVAGGRPPIDGLDENDPIQQKFLASVDPDDTPTAADLDASSYDAILFAGGHGTRGAIHHPADNFTAQTVTDGRLVTGQSPQSAKPTAEAVAALLAKR